MTYKTLGILGGGQLGQMSAKAAAKHGISVVIYTPEKNSPASLVAEKTIIAPYDDQDALKRFADQVDVISYEFENIPLETAQYLQTLKPVYPDPEILEISQDRIKEKSFLNQNLIETARWKNIQNAADINNAFNEWKTDTAIIKTSRFGYDGKGQKFINKTNRIENEVAAFAGHDLILEDVVDFTCEVSVIIARDVHGAIQIYGPVLNEHKNHILSRSIVPAPLTPDLTEKALEIGQKVALALNLIGVLAVEMFVTKDGRILVNETAPRPHNSGHWTIDACTVSQFDQHVLTVCGHSAPAYKRTHDAEMINLIGDDVENAAQYEAQSNARVHLYGKTETRPGRKMGHVTILK